MISAKDNLLTDCHPSDVISWKEFMLECEEAINNRDIHSDEISTDDENLAKAERENKKRPNNILDTNSVIKVYEKEWRSTRVCKLQVIF